MLPSMSTAASAHRLTRFTARRPVALAAPLRHCATTRSAGLRVARSGGGDTPVHQVGAQVQQDIDRAVVITGHVDSCRRAQVHGIVTSAPVAWADPLATVGAPLLGALFAVGEPLATASPDVAEPAPQLKMLIMELMMMVIGAKFCPVMLTGYIRVGLDVVLSHQALGLRGAAGGLCGAARGGASRRSARGAGTRGPRGRRGEAARVHRHDFRRRDVDGRSVGACDVDGCGCRVAQGVLGLNAGGGQWRAGRGGARGHRCRDATRRAGRAPAATAHAAPDVAPAAPVS